MSQNLQEEDSDLSKAVDLPKTEILAVMIEKENILKHVCGIFQTAQNIAQRLNIMMKAPGRTT